MSLNKAINFALALIGVLVLIFGLGYWYLFSFLPSQSANTTENSTPIRYAVAYPQSVQNSRLFLTLAFAVGDYRSPTLFHTSAEGGMVLRYSNFTAVTEKVSPDAMNTAVIAYPGTAFMEEFGIPVDIMQVMVSDNQGVIQPLTTGTSTPRKFYPSWSPDSQRIAFMASSSKEAMPQGAPEIWDIFVTDLEGEEERIGSGAYPQWSADGASLYVLRSDGIYLIDIETGAEEIKYRSDTTLDWSSSIAVDRSQRFLSLAMPSQDQVFILEFTDDGLSLVKEFPRGANSVVFSPDGNMIAVLYYIEPDVYPRLAFVNWRSGETLERMTLEGFSTDMLLLTDWVQNR